MSPEQLRGEALDARTDLFSLGLVFYEMATGRRAFSGATGAAMSAAVLHDAPAAPRQLRPDRTQTASELRAELTRLTRERSGARPPTPTPAAAAGADPRVSATMPAGVAAPAAQSSDAQLIAAMVSRHRGIVVAVAALLLLIALGAGYLVTAPGSGEAEGDPSLGGAPQHVLTGIGSGVAFSADGRRMAYVRDDGAGQTEVVIAASDGSGPEMLATRRLPDSRFWTIEGSGGGGWFAPAWSPDGTTLAVLGATADAGQVVLIDTRDGSERPFDVASRLPGVSLA